MTGLLFCLYVKLFLPSIFNSIDFWSSLSCIVLDIELADKIGIKELAHFLMAKFRDTHFVLQKKCEPTKQAFWFTRNLHRSVWNIGRLDCSELSNILPRAVNGEYSAKGTEKCKILGNLVENLENNGCPKVQDLVDKKN